MNPTPLSSTLATPAIVGGSGGSGYGGGVGGETVDPADVTLALAGLTLDDGSISAGKDVNEALRSLTLDEAALPRPPSSASKKLLILDVNGLLLDRVYLGRSPRRSPKGTPGRSPRGSPHGRSPALVPSQLRKPIATAAATAAANAAATAPTTAPPPTVNPASPSASAATSAPTSTTPLSTRVGQFEVYLRPHCKDFVRWCSDRFVVVVWSTAMRHNVVPLVDVVFAEDDAARAAGAGREVQGDSDTSIRPCAIMDQKHCSHTGLEHPEKPGKSLMLKSLSRVWEHPAVRAAAAVASVRFDATNTVLLDDSPYKTARNPAHTAMHPLEWKRTDEHDMGLAAGGAVRSALERFAAAVDGRDVCREISSGALAAIEGVGSAGGGEGGAGKGQIAGGGGQQKQWLTTADDPMYDMVRASLSVEDEAGDTVDARACSAGGRSGCVDVNKPSLVITGSSNGVCSGDDSLAGESKEERHKCPLCAFKRNPPGELQGLFYNHFRNTHADACDDAGGL